MRLSFYQHRRLASARKSTVKYEDGYAYGINRKKKSREKNVEHTNKKNLKKKGNKMAEKRCDKRYTFFYVIPSAEPEEHKLNNAS